MYINSEKLDVYIWVWNSVNHGENEHAIISSIY